jgi:hypothetical protein
MHSAEEMRDISNEPNRIKTEFAEAIVVETKPAPENKTSTDELF